MRATNAGDTDGIHDLGVRRESLLNLVVRSPFDRVILCAPPGFGKTTFARQLVAAHSESYWVDASPRWAVDDSIGDGGASSIECRIRSAMSSVVDSDAAPPDEPRCVVVDGLNFEGFQHVSRVLAGAHVDQSVRLRAVLVCDCMTPSAFRGVAGVELIDATDLRLSLNEAIRLAHALNYAGAVEDVGRVWRECAGHPALLAALLESRCVLDGDEVASVCNSRVRSTIRRIVQQWMSDEDRALLHELWLLGRGTSMDLEACQVSWSEPAASRIELLLPLAGIVRRNHNGRPSLEFNLHPALMHYFDECDESARERLDCARAAKFAWHLAERGDVVRAAMVLSMNGDEATTASFCARHGAAVVIAGKPDIVDGLVSGISLVRAISDPELLLVWSDALLELDRIEESLAKSRAVLVIAEHNADNDLMLKGQANCIDALRLLGRRDEAAEYVEAVARHTGGHAAAAGLAMLAAGKLLVYAGSYESADRVLEDVSLNPAVDAATKSDALGVLAILPMLARGDFVGSASRLALQTVAMNRSPSRLTIHKGNLASALLETGRVTRCGSLLDQVIVEGADMALAHFLPALGCVTFLRGDEEEGLGLVGDGIRKAHELGSESEAAQSRVYEAMLLRALGRFEQSLISAERAYERLCVQDLMDFSRLAATEVGSSLLALGDASAARAWGESVERVGFGENAHHAFRTAMLLALCDEAEGNQVAAVERLQAHGAHVASGNSNFQGAIYCRAFPQLLGLVARAMGVSAVPSHWLRLIPAKSTETILRNCRSNLSDAEWDLLGERLMGSEQFSAFIERRGFPMCRVRMFGGFEVSIDGRTVQEREWKKRKARMLFAMLAAGRGREFAREQIFDTLWPELTEERAKNNFYVAWSAMKGALSVPESTSGPCPYADNSGGRCRIVVTAVRSDLDDFEESRQAAREAEANGEIDAAIAAYDLLAAAYSGELMAGDPYDEWIHPLRDRYRTDFVEAMLRLGNLLLERDDPCEALPYLRRAMEVSLYREDVCQAALRCHIAAGQRGAAVDTFMACKSQLSEELGLDPSAETLALYQQILVMEDRPRYDDYGLT